MGSGGRFQLVPSHYERLSPRRTPAANDCAAGQRRDGRPALVGHSACRPRILLTGSRTWPDIPLLEATLLNVWHDAIQDAYDGILLTHGACPDGADAMGDAWAVRHGVPRDPHAADWEGPCASCCSAIARSRMPWPRAIR